MSRSHAHRGLPPWSLGIGAPAFVVLALAVFQDIVVAFVLYHVLACLVLPLVDSVVLRRNSLRHHLGTLGFGQRPTRKAVITGAAVGVAMCVGILVPLALLRTLLFENVDIAGPLEAWGVPAGAEVALFAYMLVFNSVAEELFWRGWLQSKLSSEHNRGRMLFLTVLAFTSYHVYVLIALVQNPLLALLLAQGVFAGGLVWAFLRERFNSVWPPILAHIGATAGYMTAYVVWFV